MDISETIRQYILEYLEDEFSVTNVHVGEVVPQEILTDYIWFMRGGDSYDDEELCIPRTLLSVDFNFECVSLNIDNARLLTDRCKEAFVNYQLHQIAFDIDQNREQTIQACDIDSHDDTYFPHNLQLDENLHVGTFRLTAHLGEVRST